MTGQELLDYIRADILRDVATPYLWSDALILRYLSEAESTFARKTYALLDDSQTITTVIGQATYALPTGTVFVASAALSTAASDLLNYTRKRIPNNLLTSTGTPYVFISDESGRNIRLYPVPDAVVTINLRTARLPASTIATYASPEISEEYHLDLAEYVAWRCLQANDVDGTSLGASERHKGDWLRRLEEGKREYYRLRMGANPNAVRNVTGKRN